MVVEWFETVAVVWVHSRTRDDSMEKIEAFQQAVREAAEAGLGLPSSAVYFKTRGRQEGLTQQYGKLASSGQTQWVKEGGYAFELNFSDYLDTGLFLDHRKTRAWVHDQSAGKWVLNLYAYSGSFSVYAAAGGARRTTSVDLNPNYIDWTGRNLDRNGFGDQTLHDRVEDDCFGFLATSRNHYDLIVCDPPTFSNSKKVDRVFVVDEHYPELLGMCIHRLAPLGSILFSTNSRKFKLDNEKLPSRVEIKEITQSTRSVDFEGSPGHRAWVIGLK